MWGEPEDTNGECNARLFIGDNYGDGTATMRCQLAPGHEGLHREEFSREGGPVTITWTADERKRCDHGCGQWDHAHGSRHDDDAIPCPRDADDHEYSDCTFCHPDEPPQTCEHCTKITFYKEGHLRECAMKPFTCTVCGESGVGNHDWPSGCPKAKRDVVTDDYMADDYVDPAAKEPA